MPNTSLDKSVGLVEPTVYQFDEPLELSCGRVLDSYQLVVESYGELNAQKSNAVLICHALSGSHHAAGYHATSDTKAGWWDDYIGPGKPIDTNYFCVISPNNLGGCHGSTGPKSTNPATGQPWGRDFPPLRIRDWVHSQVRLADRLGIEQWSAVIGGSLGGMNAMRWALEYPERLRHCVVIAAATKLTAQNIAFNEIARRAIQSDVNFYDGNYLDRQSIPRNGLALARMIGHVTYLSDELMGVRFGRELRSGTFKQGLEAPIEFQVESYLRHQGDRFAETFDANTYLLMTKLLDYFDLARDYNDDPVQAFSHALCKFLVISFSSDWRFAPSRSKEIVDALVAANKDVVYAEIKSNMGHDAFLMPNERYTAILQTYLKKAAMELNQIEDSHAAN
jgi:homoserine O-acetyltransferase/O-succinyltransferase